MHKCLKVQFAIDDFEKNILHNTAKSTTSYEVDAAVYELRFIPHTHSLYYSILFCCIQMVSCNGWLEFNSTFNTI